MTDEQRFSRFSGGNLAGLLAVGHTLLVIVFLSWRFGGMDTLGRTIAGCLCLPAPFITWLAWQRADAPLRRAFRRVVLPLLGIALLVAISLFNPSMHVLFSGGRPDGLILREDYIRFLPSTPRPTDTVRDFLFNVGLILLGLNVFLARPERMLQRVLLGTLAVNAAILACVGTLFKLGNATAILGTFPSPNPNFFSTFVYYNHWGAYALLSATAAAALALDYFRHRASSGEWLQTPAALLGVLTLLLLVTLPLSRARASTAAGVCFALFIATRILTLGRSRSQGRSRWIVVIAMALVGVSATTWLAKDHLRSVFQKTSRQIADLKSGGIGDARPVIYRDTLKLIAERPVFGWGWESYYYAFYHVQSAEFRTRTDQKRRTVVLDAHNDWLQLIAELGLVGGLLSLATGVAVAKIAPRRWWRISPSAEIVAGIACLGLLAAVDFPFACPVVVATAWTLLMTAAAIAYDRKSQAATA